MVRLENSDGQFSKIQMARWQQPRNTDGKVVGIEVVWTPKSICQEMSSSRNL
jgi:hypothetical protein